MGNVSFLKTIIIFNVFRYYLKYCVNIEGLIAEMNEKQRYSSEQVDKLYNIMIRDWSMPF